MVQMSLKTLKWQQIVYLWLAGRSVLCWLWRSPSEMISQMTMPPQSAKAAKRKMSPNPV